MPKQQQQQQQQSGKAFEAKKRTILQALAADDADYSDASPKGSVDEPIRALLGRINAWPGLVTTSSCSGRVSVYVDGPGRIEVTHDEVAADEIAEEAPVKEQQQNARAGGKGGGRWLYTSHDPHEAVSWAAVGVEQVARALNMSSHGAKQAPIAPDATTVPGQHSLVHFKFEPMILHVLTSSLSIAQRVLGAAQQAGFRESGISSAMSEMPIVAIRTNGLALESLIGVEDHGHFKSIIDLSYLQILFALAETRFKENKQRTDRLEEMLCKTFTSESSSSNNNTWEDAETRRQRKRAEGLARQAEMHDQKE